MKLMVITRKMQYKASHYRLLKKKKVISLSNLIVTKVFDPTLIKLNITPHKKQTKNKKNMTLQQKMHISQKIGLKILLKKTKFSITLPQKSMTIY